MNPSLVGLVKIGFSTKDPAIRARELSNTAVPRQYSVAYEALVESPRDLEQRVHSRLKSHRDSKEFFRITPEVALEAIQAVASDIGAILQLERCSLQSNLDEPVSPTAPPAPPAAAAPPPRFLTPSSVRTRSKSDLHQLRKARVTFITRRQVIRACPYCGSHKAPSPSGYCQACFGLHCGDEVGKPIA